jgi:hypothetical protein
MSRVDSLCTPFKSMDDGAAIYSDLAANLHRRGHRIAAVRSHAKLFLFELTDQLHIVIESSANLRSCRNVEACLISNDRALLLFHCSWMLKLLEQPR